VSVRRPSTTSVVVFSRCFLPVSRPPSRQEHSTHRHEVPFITARSGLHGWGARNPKPPRKFSTQSTSTILAVSVQISALFGVGINRSLRHRLVHKKVLHEIPRTCFERFQTSFSALLRLQAGVELHISQDPNSGTSFNSQHSNCRDLIAVIVPKAHLKLQGDPPQQPPEAAAPTHNCFQPGTLAVAETLATPDTEKRGYSIGFPRYLRLLPLSTANTLHRWCTGSRDDHRRREMGLRSLCERASGQQLSTF
jgi:hypothetical protein